MLATTCAKCEGLYQAPDVEPAGAPRVCPRCLAVAELLLAADALNARVRADLEKSARSTVFMHRAEALPLSERLGTAIAKARAQ